MSKIKTKIVARQFPKSIIIPEIEDKIQHYGLQAISRLYLQEHFNVETLDELLQKEQVYKYIDDMKDIISTFEEEK